MKKLKLYKKNKSQKSKLSEIFDVVKNADQRACSLLTLLTVRYEAGEFGLIHYTCNSI